MSAVGMFSSPVLPMEYWACTLRAQHNKQQTISPCLNFMPIFDSKTLLSGGSKVRYAIAGHMGKRFVAASDFFICDKITSNVFDMQEKNGEITLNCCSNSAIFILPR